MKAKSHSGVALVKLNGRDIAPRCPRPSQRGRNEISATRNFSQSVPSPDASLGDRDGAARRPYRGNAQSGVALVITLILLSVITFMAVTFLVISRHEGAQVDTVTQQAMAKNAAESGSQQAIAQIIAEELASTNGLNGNLKVSTNFMSLFFDNSSPSTPGYRSITNVSYYDKNGNFLTGNDLLQMLSNQVILPRVPVFITSNKNQTTGADFRFWLDLNRNGIYDANGAVWDGVDANNNHITNIYVGDPEWIGVLNHPEQRHSANNLYVGRFAFIALPIGNSLDVNYIHNQAKGMGAWDNGYLRNQGVGSWELNLAGFLHHLNPNWDNTDPPYNRTQYIYKTNNSALAGIPLASIGSSFDDATQIIQYRYGQNWNNLRSFVQIYDRAAVFPKPSAYFTSDFIDGYSRGPLMTGLSALTVDADLFKTPWSGDFSTNQYFTTQDLFNQVPYFQNIPARALTSFSNHLYTIGRTYTSLINNTKGSVTNSYNRYTFYNLLSQMSFGAASEPVGYGALNGNANFSSVYGSTPKMNLNYVNINGTNATNFIPWTPQQFFTNAADRMLRAYFPNQVTLLNGQKVYLSLTNIPVFPVNYYTPAVHRILQLAANIYDATSNKTVAYPYDFDYPSAFRPYFGVQSIPGQMTNIYIAGYDEVTNNVDLTVPRDLRRTLDLGKFLSTVKTSGNGIRQNVFGVPYVIGAKKGPTNGFPSFSKFSSIPTVQMWRALELDRSQAGGAAYGPKWKFNVRYTFAISNYIAVECWNPSSIPYPRSVTIYASDDYNMVMTNSVGAQPVGVQGTPGITTNIVPPSTTWPGWTGGGGINNPSFKAVLSNSVVAVGNAYLQATPPAIIFTTNSGTSITFENNTNFYIPQFVFNVTNRVRLVMVDTASGRLLDYVLLGGIGQVGGPETSNNIMSDLAAIDPTFWSNNMTAQGIPNGFNNQVLLAEGQLAGATPDQNYWKSLPLSPGETSQGDAIRDFRNWVANRNPTNLVYQVPLVALRTYAMLNNTWSPNDPLVHYTMGDLTDALNPPKAYDFNNGGNPLTDPRGIPLGMVNSKRYQPWNNNNHNLHSVDSTNQIAYKDPLAVNYDSWQFPTNKFPNVGWLGRVHRGTPWQTVYLKPSFGVLGTNDWPLWTGHTNAFDWTNSMPQNDWALMDLFTTSPNENASKGQLSINQTNEAAWAAVLDGLITIKNTNNISPTNIAPVVINQSELDSVNGTNTIRYLVDRINAARTNFAGNTFSSLGQICSVPELTVNSPYLNLAFTNSLSDAAYERIPQQMMSLVRLGSPRYVIFSYGQSLKPADRSIVQSGPYFGMCTNYQITGEVATRMVVRIDNYPVPGQPQTQPRAVIESFNVLGPE